MAHSPGEIVYTINSVRFTDASCSKGMVVLRWGVVDKNGAIAYRSAAINVALDDTLAASLQQALVSLVAAKLPNGMAGAVPE